MEKLRQVKVVLLGAQAAGKTCLMRRFVDEIFLENQKYQSSIGAVFVGKTLQSGKKKVLLNIWDTAGQERFHSLSRMYYRGAQVAIICYDVTDQQSFERGRFWVEELGRTEENCEIYLCATKNDLESKKINPEMVKSYAESINAVVMYTSSKTGENVEELFQMIARNAISSSKEDVKTIDTIMVKRSPRMRKKCC